MVGIWKWWAKGILIFKMAKWCQVVLFSARRTIQSMANLISQLCGDLQLATCLSRQDGKPLKDHPTTHGCLTSLKIKPQQKQPGYLSAPTATLNRYFMCTATYRVMVMVKCVLLLCVWSQLLSNPVTFVLVVQVTLKIECCFNLTNPKGYHLAIVNLILDNNLLFITCSFSCFIC